MDLAQYAGAIATIAAVILGAIISYAVFWVRSRRGNWVNVTKVSETPLLTVSDQIKEDLEIKYRGKDVDSLVITTLEMVNTSGVHIKDFEVSLTYKASEIEAFSFRTIFGLDDPMDLVGFSAVYSPDRTQTKILREYFRPYKKYKTDKITVSLLSDDRLSIMVSGGGLDWQARYIDKPTEPFPRLELVTLAIILLLFFGQNTLITIFPFLGQGTILLIVMLMAIAMAMRQQLKKGMKD